MDKEPMLGRYQHGHSHTPLGMKIGWDGRILLYEERGTSVGKAEYGATAKEVSWGVKLVPKTGGGGVTKKISPKKKKKKKRKRSRHRRLWGKVVRKIPPPWL